MSKIKFKRRSKAERNKNGGLFPKVEKRPIQKNLSESNTYLFDGAFKKARQKVKTKDNYVCLAFTRKIEKIRGE